MLVRTFWKMTVLNLALLALPVPAHAENDIGAALKEMEPLALVYGANDFISGTLKGLIVRGWREAGSAGSGDVYSVLLQDGDKWQVAFRNDRDYSPLFTTAPHNHDDSLVSLRLFRGKSDTTRSEGNKTYFPLYILQALRDAEEALRTGSKSLRQPSHVVLTLYQLARDKSFGIYSFRPIEKQDAAPTYCNADWALWKELAVPLPQDGHRYQCEEP